MEVATAINYSAMTYYRTGSSSASVFGENPPMHGSPSFTTETFYDLKRARNAEFRDLVKKRCEYLDSLKSLSPDWASGNSSSPSPEVLELVKKVLVDLNGLLEINKFLPKPSLVMGPIPVGGFSLEIVLKNRFAIYFSAYNNGGTEIEVEDFQDGSFIELVIQGNSKEFLIKNAYQRLSEELITA